MYTATEQVKLKAGTVKTKATQNVGLKTCEMNSDMSLCLANYDACVSESHCLSSLSPEASYAAKN